MKDNTRAVSTATRLSRASLAAGIAVALALGVSACKKDAETPAPGTPGGSAATAPAAPPVAVSSSVAAMGADQLREAAQKALAEQRLYAPAGNNAMEYYLALRDKSANDAAVASALTDLQPYTLIATEQAIARKDVAEANRLYALLEKADSAAPALPRLKNGIAEAEKAAAAAPVAAAQTPEEKAKQAELEKKRLEEQKRLQEQAARELAAKQAQQQQQTAAAATQQQQAAAAAAAKAEADRVAAAQKAEADRRAAAEKAEADRRAAAAREAAPAAAPRPTAGSLRPISQPGPKFPAEALRTGQTGNVTVEFTVNTDGSVGAARVVSSTPARVFDRAALDAIRRWRYEPVSAPVTQTRNFQFAPGN